MTSPLPEDRIEKARPRFKLRDPNLLRDGGDRYWGSTVFGRGAAGVVSLAGVANAVDEDPSRTHDWWYRALNLHFHTHCYNAIARLP